MSLSNTFKTYFLATFALAVLCLCACSEDEEFMDGSGASIEFSTDTVSFDTIFTNIGSATKTFKIYNRNNKGVRLSSVRLGSNGSSGFRVNLDGQYNTQFTDVEIYHEDSIFCFVEVTINPHDSDSPILITDSLLFTLQNGRTQKVILQAFGQDAIVMRSEEITEDKTLDARRPYIIYDSLVVRPEATLTIKEGTTLCFHAGASLAVHGQVIAKGTLEKPIIFRGDRLDNLLDYMPYDQTDAQWGGIHLYAESQENVFDFCDIHGGSYGIITERSDPNEIKLTLTNSIIHNVAGDALRLRFCTADIGNSQITNAKGYCVNILGGDNQFVHCTIGQFYPWSGECGSALNFTNFENDTIYPIDRLVFYNSIITGFKDDEVFGSRLADVDAAFNYLFDHCLVNTKTTEDDAPFFIECKIDTLGRKSSSKINPTDKDEKKPKDREGNFRNFDYHLAVYDFRLDTLSVARGLGSGKNQLYPYDRRGVKRPEEHPDAGCYQFEL